MSASIVRYLIANPRARSHLFHPLASGPPAGLPQAASDAAPGSGSGRRRRRTKAIISSLDDRSEQMPQQLERAPLKLGRGNTENTQDYRQE